MKKLRLTSCALALSLALVSCGETKKKTAGSEVAVNTEQTIEEARSEEANVLEEEVAASLEYLSSDALEGRKTGTKGAEMAARFIEGTFKEVGVKPYFETYRDSFEVEGVTGYNIIGFKEGSDPELKDEFIILGAHYDHIGTGEAVEGDVLANGANDNATGTTAVLELAEYFADKETKRSILFTLFSAEELGLVGAKHLSSRLKEEDLNLYVMFNIEMIGVPMPDKNYSAYLTGYTLSNLAEKFNDYAGAEVVGFLPQAKEFQLFRRSDNYPFYEEFQVPAQTISTFDFTNYDYYHHVKDEFELMDTKHMTELIEEIIPGITKMANTPVQEIKMNEE